MIGYFLSNNHMAMMDRVEIQEDEKIVKEEKKKETNDERDREEEVVDERIKEYGQAVLNNEDKGQSDIFCLTIIGQVEGHVCLSEHNKTTKYEHLLPKLAEIEEDDKIKGILLLINTVGGDVEAGLAIAEMIASLSKPTVSLVLGGGHSIGVPLSVSTNYSYIVKSATMTIHPVRMNGTVIGVSQTFEYFERMQDRILDFITAHSKIDHDKLKSLMLNRDQLAKDVGTIIVGQEAVDSGLIDEIGGVKEAIKKLHEMIDEEE